MLKHMDGIMQLRIVTVIPAYNEAKTVEDVALGAGKHGDVIVVDDGSTDGTSDLAERGGATVIRHERNLGKGAALKTGIRTALHGCYDVIVFMDADGQHSPDFIPELAEAAADGSLVIGSRFAEDNFRNMPVHRRFSNRLTTFLLRRATGYSITDSQSGFRAIASEHAGLLTDIPYNDYIYESEVIYEVSKQGLGIVEVPINCRYNGEKSYIGVLDVLKYIKFVFKLLLRKFKS